MPKNDDGEFELVLGNRQLLSGFFIIVILFGIFFTMGYFVGRSSSPSSVAPIPTGGTAAAASSRPPLAPGQAEVVTSEPKRESAAAPISTRTALDSGARASSPEEPSVEPPAQKPPKARPAAEAKAADPSPKEEKKKGSPKESSGSRTSGDGEIPLTRPKKGDMYLQVSAPLPAAAKGVVGALHRQGIDAIVAPGPVGKETVRVLVGPLADSASAGKMRARLAEVGFKDSFIQKY